jgi:hypothetical protein
MWKNSSKLLLNRLHKLNSFLLELEILSSTFHLFKPALKEGPLTTSNQLLSPYTVALRLR